MLMSSSESPLALRPAEDPLYSRTRKTSKNEQQQEKEEEEEEEVEVTSFIKRQRRISKGVLDALGVSCQVAHSTASEVVALWNPPVADGPGVDPAAAAVDVNEIPRESTAIATMDIEDKMPVRIVCPAVLYTAQKWPRNATSAAELEEIHEVLTSHLEHTIHLEHTGVSPSVGVPTAASALEQKRLPSPSRCSATIQRGIYDRTHAAFERLGLAVALRPWRTIAVSLTVAFILTASHSKYQTSPQP